MRINSENRKHCRETETAEVRAITEGAGGGGGAHGDQLHGLYVSWVCMSDCVSIPSLQVPLRAPEWPRFQSARRLCWHWGSRLGPLARGLDMPSSRKPVGTVLRAGRSPPRSVRLFLVYVLLRPLLFFHSIIIIQCEPDKWAQSSAVIIISCFFLTQEKWNSWL